MRVVELDKKFDAYKLGFVSAIVANQNEYLRLYNLFTKFYGPGANLEDYRKELNSWCVFTITSGGISSIIDFKLYIAVKDESMLTAVLAVA